MCGVCPTNFVTYVFEYIDFVQYSLPECTISQAPLVRESSYAATR
jgi:hypothetical protein